WESGLLENALMNQGEEDVLKVYLAQDTHKTKYLALLNMASLADPLDTDTIATLSPSESGTPGSGGYARQQVLNTDWAAPSLVGEDFRRETSAAKTFGAFTGAGVNITHVLVVTTLTGVTSPTTLALAHMPLGTQVSVAVGQTFTFTPSFGAM